jgi:hypothetical protein
VPDDAVPPRPLTLTDSFAALRVSPNESLGGRKVVSVRGEHGLHVAVRALPLPPAWAPLSPAWAAVEAAARAHAAAACPALPPLPS